MKTMAILTGVLLLAGPAISAQTTNAKPRTVVLELFTSQGCSSCPPADALLSKLQRENIRGATLIPLAYHVDYWNRLGWTDPFSSKRWSQRQNDYARVMHNDQLYTPQLIINGEMQIVGNGEREVRQGIARQLTDNDRGAIAISRVARAGNKLTVDLHAQREPNANVVVTLIENDVTTDVAGGENKNRKLTNDAIVRWQGLAKGDSITIPIDPAWHVDHMDVVAFLQDPKSLEIYTSAARNVAQ